MHTRLSVALPAALLLAPLALGLPEAPPPVKGFIDGLPPHCLVTVTTTPPNVGVDCEDTADYGKSKADGAATLAADQRVLP